MPHAIDLGGYLRCVSRARELFGTTKQEHPKLAAYLVVASRSSQCSVDSSIAELLVECPELFIDDEARTEGTKLVRARDRATKAIEERTRQTTEERLTALRHELGVILERWAAHQAQLSFEPTSQLELRFHRLDYALIGGLQSHALVDHRLTPQTAASIRIVFGSLASLAEP